LSFEDFSNMICELKISACIPLLRNMRPPLMYPQLPHLHDHGLAILACITPFQNMRPPPISTLNESTPFHLKRSCWRNVFSPLISSKPPSPQETDHRKREREKEEEKVLIKKEKKERKLQESLQIKGEVNILRGEKHFNFKNYFLYDSIFSPSIIPFWKPFPNHWENFLNSFWTIGNIHDLSCTLLLYPWAPYI
jgi:hypothetical protein